MDIYKTRTMLAALKQMKKAKTFLCSTVFKKIEEVASVYVDIDIQKGARRLGAYVSPLLEGKVVDRQGYETKTFQPPYIKLKMKTTATDYETRMPGEHIYASNDTPATRAAKQVGEDLAELDEMITRMEEVQCSQAIQTGKVICIGEGITLQVDFGMSNEAKPVLTGSDRWSDHTNADPINDLSVWHEAFSKRSGRVAGMCIMGYDAIRNMLNCTKFQQKLDNRRIVMGQINPTALNEMGVKYWGYLDEPGIDVYTYSEWYIDPVDKIEKPMIQDDKVILLDPSARFVRHYGMIKDLKGNGVAARFPQSWEQDDPSVRWIMLQSAPICAPHQIDAITCATVL